ncbi:hypothetical protein [Actinomadura geliboluensis]|uniref:hypothetical protein n=1 Tax=Actinomadura geliboluensis TaxID=882440 RepID=UPI002628BB10|nr:hypothetical protein [Actinomadura geliboluensis]
MLDSKTFAYLGERAIAVKARTFESDGGPGVAVKAGRSSASWSASSPGSSGRRAGLPDPVGKGPATRHAPARRGSRTPSTVRAAG